MALAFFIVAILFIAYVVGYILTHAPEMPDYEAESRAQQEEEDFIE